MQLSHKYWSVCVLTGVVQLYKLSAFSKFYLVLGTSSIPVKDSIMRMQSTSLCLLFSRFGTMMSFTQFCFLCCFKPFSCFIVVFYEGSGLNSFEIGSGQGSFCRDFFTSLLHLDNRLCSIKFYFSLNLKGLQVLDIFQSGIFLSTLSFSLLGEVKARPDLLMTLQVLTNCFFKGQFVELLGLGLVRFNDGVQRKKSYVIVGPFGELI